MKRNLLMFVAMWVAVGWLHAQVPDLSGCVTTGTKGNIPNTGALVTGVDTSKMATAISGYVGAKTAYAYSPTNKPALGTDTVARALGFYAYSPTNRPSAGDIGAITNESTTLAQAAARGGFAGTETISISKIHCAMFGIDAGKEASGFNWTAYGNSAGQYSSGTYWGAYGNFAGMYSTGDYWGSFGFNSGNTTTGNRWNAFGCEAGCSGAGNDWCAFGNFAGTRCTGNNKWYGGNYTSYPPNLDANYVASDIDIYSDNGQLNLGRTGALTNAAPNALRGVWLYKGSVVAATSDLAAYVPIADGISSNQTLVNAAATGTFTLNGVPLGSSSQSYASSLTPLVNVATGAVVTIAWSNAPSVAYIGLTGPATITNDLTALGLNCSSNADKHLVVDVAAWAATNVAWDARMIWRDGTPDISVTGRYEFAMSTACGTNIFATQTFPAVYMWRNSSMAARASANPTSVGNIRVDALTTTETNSYVLGTCEDPRRAVIFKLRFVNSASDSAAIQTFVGVNYSYTDSSGAVRFSPAYFTSMSAAGLDKVVTVYCPPVENYSPLFSYRYSYEFYRTNTVSTGILRLYEPQYQYATPLHASAYNAGWRP